MQKWLQPGLQCPACRPAAGLDATMKDSFRHRAGLPDHDFPGGTPLDTAYPNHRTTLLVIRRHFLKLATALISRGLIAGMILAVAASVGLLRSGAVAAGILIAACWVGAGYARWRADTVVLS